MVQAARQSGTADRRSVFELFPRRLPEGRRYGVVAGVGRALDAIEAFRFDAAAIAALEGVVDPDMLDWLASYRFTGDVWGYAEGEAYFPHSPLLVVEGTFAEAVLLETVLLSIYNHDSAIASAASRMILAAGGRPCIEMGSRRTHEQAAVAAARAAYVAGFDATSNLAARAALRRPVRRHRRALLHAAARRRGRRLPRAGADARRRAPPCSSTPTTSPRPCACAVEVAGTGLGAVRLDSGDLGLVARDVRAQLDSLGATSTRIVVTSDLDEHAIAALAAAPVDAYGVGTQLVTGSGHPTCGFVYKLVAREGDDGELVSVAKRSTDKVSVGGRKYALRRRSAAGTAQAEVVGIGEPPADDGDDARRPSLLVPLVRDGEVVGRATLDEARARHRASLAELPRAVTMMSAGEPVIPTVFEGA